MDSIQGKTSPHLFVLSQINNIANYFLNQIHETSFISHKRNRATS